MKLQFLNLSIKMEISGHLHVLVSTPQGRTSAEHWLGILTGCKASLYLVAERENPCPPVKTSFCLWYFLTSPHWSEILPTVIGFPSRFHYKLYIFFRIQIPNKTEISDEHHNSQKGRGSGCRWRQQLHCTPGSLGGTAPLLQLSCSPPCSSTGPRGQGLH